MTQRVKGLLTNAGDPSSVPGIHVKLKGESQPHTLVLWSLHVYHGMHAVPWSPHVYHGMHAVLWSVHV